MIPLRKPDHVHTDGFDKPVYYLIVAIGRQSVALVVTRRRVWAIVGGPAIGENAGRGPSARVVIWRAYSFPAQLETQRRQGLAHRFLVRQLEGLQPPQQWQDRLRLQMPTPSFCK